MTRSGSIPHKHPAGRYRFGAPAAVWVAPIACMLTCTGCLEPGTGPAGDTQRTDRRPADRLLDVGGDANYDAGKGLVRLDAAINEVVGLAFTVADSGEVDVQVGAFTSPTGRKLSGNMHLFRRHSVVVGEWPGWHLRHVPPGERRQRVDDVLVPARSPQGGLPALLAPGEQMRGWLDIRVPKGTVPEQYTAWMDVLVNGTVAHRHELRLTVWPFVLPDRAQPALVTDLDQRSLFMHHVQVDGRPYGPVRILASSPRRDVLEDCLRSTMRVLHDHRLTPQLPFLFPATRIDAESRLRVDFTDYLRVVEPYLTGTAYSDRLGEPIWTLPLDESFPQPPEYGPLSSPTFSRLLRDYVTSADQVLRDNGWQSRAHVRIPFSRLPYADAAECVRHFGYIFKTAAPRLAVWSGLFPQDMEPRGWWGFQQQDLLDYVDIWAPKAQFYPSGPRGLLDPDRYWLTADRPPFSGTTMIQAKPADVRVLAYQGSATGAEAVYLGPANDWPAPGAEPVSAQTCADFDPFVLLYPGWAFGLTEPVPSMRLKHLRRGAQDLALLALLDHRVGGETARELRDAMVRYCAADASGVHFLDARKPGWPSDPSTWRLAREIMVDALLASLEGTHAGATARPGAALRRRRFMDERHTVELEVAGVRAVPEGLGLDSAVIVSCTVRIANFTLAPIGGELRFVDLPVGWSATPASVHLPTLAPGESVNAVLQCRTDSLTWNEGGVRELAVEFDRGEAGVRGGIARFCHVTATRLDEAIQIDGDLSDWGPAVGNFASGFVHVSDPGDGRDSNEDRNPTHETLCFVGMHERRLRIALRCATDVAGSARTAGRAGRIDDLVPRGGELVELLLDPRNAGTRTPGDLYRIAVQPSGVSWERGVTTDPPVGPTRVWPASIRHAVRVYPDHWTAEIEIPLDAFGSEARRGTIWGLNFTRFDASAQEFSNWSGARRNVYDPLTLGNLTVP